ncbi:MAG: exodeoxyribonuclease III [Candidatus Pacebacteria bacterium]|nr:exodeoxyribonuclease III [Candidatus Paceibacterota bacterium]
MKIISWNVNGIRAWNIKPGTLNFIKTENADIVCFQETKAQPEQIEELELFKKYPFHYWHSAEKKGYSSTGIISKTKPIKIWYGMKNSPIENEGRIINAEFEKFILVTVYTPNAKGDLSRLSLRYDKWDRSFLKHMQKLEKKKPVIVCGDLNVAHMPIDLARPDANKTTDKKPGGAGFTDQERERFSDFINAGFIDSFRHINPEKVQYSWWSYRAGARDRNVGWRIDYFLTSKKLKSKISDAIIYDQQHGSDHCPVGIEVKI